MQDPPAHDPATAAHTDPHAIDYRLLSVLCLHAMITQIVYAMVRVTISYRTIELGLPPVWVGLITGSPTRRCASCCSSRPFSASATRC
jgi:hypothetical protein